LVRDAERIARAVPDSLQTHSESGITRQASTDLDIAWREAVTITNTERLIGYGNDGPYESDRSLPAEDRDRRDSVVTHISGQTGVPTWYLKGEILSAVHTFCQVHGTGDDPDFFAPPGWDDLIQRYAAAHAADAAYQAEGEWDRAPSGETTSVYKEPFDRDAELVGDGQAADIFSGQLGDSDDHWFADGSEYDEGDYTRAPLRSHRDAEPVTTDHPLSVGEILAEWAPPPGDESSAPVASPRDDAQYQRGAGIPAGWREAVAPGGDRAGQMREWLRAHMVPERTADRAPGRVNTHDELQTRVDALRAQVSQSAAPEVEERGGESPGKPAAAEVVAQAHAAVLASEPTSHPTPAVTGHRVAGPRRLDDTGAGL
ncbi:MAG: hypothetical protein ACRDQX_15170, partial [Pseudonocardiaceae bacterium]